MGKEIAMQLAEFTVQTKYSEIPTEVLDFTKNLTLKTTAGMLAGSVKPSGKKMAEIIRRRKLPAEAGAIGCGFKTTLWEAVFLNAFLAHASELEDDTFSGGTAWDITVIPLLFPVAQKLKLSGQALMEALVLGMEVHTRTCLFPAEHLGLMIIPGAVGPAAAAARALGLNVQETASALGLAMSGVPLTGLNFGTDGHYFESSIHSLQGIMAAEMAKEGMDSNPDLASFLTSFLGKEKVAPERMVEDLGKKWLLQNIWIKKYPCCFGLHRQVDTLLELKKQHNFSNEQVVAIEVHTNNVGAWLTRPKPKTEGDVQFSMEHALASALLDGDVTLSHITVEKAADPKFIAAGNKVKVICHPDWVPGVLEETIRVTVKTKDGGEYSGERRYPIGAPTEPLTVKQCRSLYAKFTEGILTAKLIEKTGDAIQNLDKLKNIEELMDTITSRA